VLTLGFTDCIVAKSITDTELAVVGLSKVEIAVSFDVEVPRRRSGLGIVMFLVLKLLVWVRVHVIVVRLVI